MAEYRLSPMAQRDLEAIFDYTVAQWDVSQAVRYIDHIEAECAELEGAASCAGLRPYPTELSPA